MNYYRTLIAVADDCPVAEGTVPSERGGKVTVASLQYAMIAQSPHVHTQEDVLFQSWFQRQDLPKNQSKAKLARLRAELFAKPQPCLRSSPLPKIHGWGLLFDEQGRVALCAMESKKYRQLLDGRDPGVKVLKALRSKRA